MAEVLVRSPLTCQSRYGVCRTCYGRNLATGSLVGIGEAVGIIAAQSIGEPGTQLTMRTFHTGGVAGLDITAGLPRVEELFEARMPKGKAEISHIDGVVEIIQGENGARRVKVTSREAFDTPLRISKGHEVLLGRGRHGRGEPGRGALETGRRRSTRSARSTRACSFAAEDGLRVRSEDVVEREYAIPHNAKLLVENGQMIRAGDPITDGPINPQEYLETRGRDAVQRYLVKEVQRVYRSQGVTINDKHIEIIVRQMLRKVRIDQPGDSEQLPFELVDKFDFEEINNKVLAEGGEPATAETVLLGVTKASLNTSSFLAAASFQETTRVLTEAAINGAKDRLIGPQGERHHRQAHPGRDRARRPTWRLAARPSVAPRPRHSPVASCRRASARTTTSSSPSPGAPRGDGGAEGFNPLLEGREAARPQTAEDGLANPFLEPDDDEDDDEDDLPSLTEEDSEPARA